ncbi:MAG: CDP-glucose 4,6-dehydratase [Prevotellaceae bacterium]|jgi:CDP-glucose 4,6-dehydratase|nr:CDP-glucose 4,6-dehydratase [Prevotellaceae bacterium]
MALSFYRGKKVFVTGHTGFKGTWLCHILLHAGADVTGYALEPPTKPSLFAQTGLAKKMHSIIGDIRDREVLIGAIQAVMPDILFHLAAQPLVRCSYQKPAETYETNVLGTVNVLEAMRFTRSIRSVVNVTTDKVYENKEWLWGYRENENLCGYDPYSNSKSCSELVTASYRNSFFSNKDDPALSTARSGNVIGGGDYATDRVIPDCIRAAMFSKQIILRNPHSVRPYQHVLECLSGYLLLAEKQYDDPDLAGAYNFGPDELNCITTGQLAELFCSAWGAGACWTAREDNGPHEADLLKLDCSKAKTILGWKPRWDVRTAVEKVIEFARCDNDTAYKYCLDKQVEGYFK